MEASESSVCQTICANDDLGALLSLSCHDYRGEDCWSESSAALHFNCVYLFDQCSLVLFEGLFKALVSLDLTVCLEVLEIHKLVSTDNLSDGHSIPDHGNATIKGHDSNLSLICTL